MVVIALGVSLVTFSACGDDEPAAEVAAKPETTDVELTATPTAGPTDPAASAAASGTAAPSSRYEHEFSETYAGPVWITISSEADAADVMLTWGPYSVSFEHRGASADYWFTKSAADAPGAGVPVMVMVAPAATVTFHEGDPPADAIDVNEGWVQQG